MGLTVFGNHAHHYRASAHQSSTRISHHPVDVQLCAEVIRGGDFHNNLVSKKLGLIFSCHDRGRGGSFWSRTSLRATHGRARSGADWDRSAVGVPRRSHISFAAKATHFALRSSHAWVRGDPGVGSGRAPARTAKDQFKQHVSAIVWDRYMGLRQSGGTPSRAGDRSVAPSETASQ